MKKAQKKGKSTVHYYSMKEFGAVFYDSESFPHPADPSPEVEPDDPGGCSDLSEYDDEDSDAAWDQ